MERAPREAAADGDLDALRAALSARLDACLERLDDVVSELAAVHELPEELIVQRIRRTVAAERALLESSS